MQRVGKSKNTSISEALCAWVESVDNAHIPDAVLQIARLSLLDWASVTLAGVGEPVSDVVRKLVSDEQGAPQASVAGLTKKLPMRAAALANGTTSHALDYDDTHFAHIGHPSVAIIPAALAVAEKQQLSMPALVAACALGMEASIRVGLWLGRSHYQHGFHQTATAGAFGATLAAAKLAGLSEQQMRYAMGIAATRSSGLKAQFGTMGKPFNAGMAASNGVEAMALAKSGMVSRLDALECERGFGETHASDDFTKADAFAGIGEQYYLNALQYKFHACCHGTHAAIEACKQIAGQHDVSIDQITKISIIVHPRWLSVCDIKNPSTGLEAKFSLACCAVMVFCGLETAAIETFSDDLCSVAHVNSLQRLVEVGEDAHLSEMQARVSVVLSDAQELNASFDLADEIGLDELQVKLRGKAEALVGVEAVEVLWGIIGCEDAMAAEFGERLAALSVQ